MSRERLLKLKAELEAVAESGDESAAIVELDQAKVGRLSRMDAMQAQAMAKASAERREQMLRRIEAALVRVANTECVRNAESRSIRNGSISTRL